MPYQLLVISLTTSSLLSLVWWSWCVWRTYKHHFYLALAVVLVAAVAINWLLVLKVPVAAIGSLCLAGAICVFLGNPAQKAVSRPEWRALCLFFLLGGCLSYLAIGGSYAAGLYRERQLNAIQAGSLKSSVTALTAAGTSLQQRLVAKAPGLATTLAVAGVNQPAALQQFMVANGLDILTLTTPNGTVLGRAQASGQIGDSIALPTEPTIRTENDGQTVLLASVPMGSGQFVLVAGYVLTTSRLSALLGQSATLALVGPNGIIPASSQSPAIMATRDMFLLAQAMQTGDQDVTVEFGPARYRIARAGISTGSSLISIESRGHN